MILCLLDISIYSTSTKPDQIEEHKDAQDHSIPSLQILVFVELEQGSLLICKIINP